MVPPNGFAGGGSTASAMGCGCAFAVMSSLIVVDDFKEEDEGHRSLAFSAGRVGEIR